MGTLTLPTEPDSPLARLTVDEMAELLASIPAPSLKIKVGQTYPPVRAYLTDGNGPFDMSVMSALTFAMKGATIGPLVSGVGTSLQSTFTATATNNNSTLSAVSSFNNLFGPLRSGAFGSVLIGPNIPPPVLLNGVWVCTTIAAMDVAAQTIRMSAPAIGAGSATNVGNQGLAQYVMIASDSSVVDTYLVEWKMTLSGGGVLFFPSESDLNQSIEVDANLGET